MVFAAFTGPEGEEGWLLSLTPEGEVYWRRLLPGIWAASSQLLGADGVLYTSVQQGGDVLLLALDGESGMERWSLPMPGMNCRMALSPSGVLYGICGLGALRAIRTESAGLASSPWPKLYADARNTSCSRSAITAVEEEASPLPQATTLLPACPNPFNGETLLRYRLAERVRVRLRVYDAAGQVVCCLVDQVQEAGAYQVWWRAKEQASGVYLCWLEAGGFSQVRRMVLVQ